jgi:hypothetical protein
MKTSLSDKVISSPSKTLLTDKGKRSTKIDSVVGELEY